MGTMGNVPPSCRHHARIVEQSSGRRDHCMLGCSDKKGWEDRAIPDG